MSLLFLLLCFTDTSQALRVGTLNCEFMNREKVHIKYGFSFMLKDDDLPLWEADGFREKKFEQVLDPVAKVIVKMNLDTIVLTEVGGQRDVKDLRDAIKAKGLDYPWFFVSDSESVTFQHVAVLSKFPLELVTAKIPGHAFYDQELDDPEEESEAGVQKGIHVTFEYEGQKIHIIGVHLPSERNGHEQDAMRIAVASVVRRYSVPLIERGEHVMIIGDLNDSLGQPAIRMIRGREDIFEDLIQTGHTRFFQRKEYKERWTYMYKGSRNQLDHVLMTRSLRVLCAEEGGIVAHVQKVDIGFRPNINQPRTSDHRGFMVELFFK